MIKLLAFIVLLFGAAIDAFYIQNMPPQQQILLRNRIMGNRNEHMNPFNEENENKLAVLLKYAYKKNGGKKSYQEILDEYVDSILGNQYRYQPKENYGREYPDNDDVYLDEFKSRVLDKVYRELDESDKYESYDNYDRKYYDDGYDQNSYRQDDDDYEKMKYKPKNVVYKDNDYKEYKEEFLPIPSYIPFEPEYNPIYGPLPEPERYENVYGEVNQDDDDDYSKTGRYRNKKNQYGFKKSDAYIINSLDLSTDQLDRRIKNNAEYGPFRQFYVNSDWINEHLVPFYKTVIKFDENTKKFDKGKVTNINNEY